MAHEILGSRFRQRDTFGRPAWHKLGKSFSVDRTVLASEAVEEVAGDVVVEARPLFYVSAGGQKIALPNHQAIVRLPVGEDPEEKVFGVTSDRWVSVSYVALARALDELSKVYKVETVGLIEEGSLCFISFRGPKFSVKGDEMNDYFLANLSNKVGEGHKVLATPERTVCKNTNMLANEHASISLVIPHSMQAVDRIKMAADLVAKFQTLSSKMQEIFNLFAGTKILSTQVDQIIDAAFPLPAEPSELRLFRQALTTQEQSVLEKVMGTRFGLIIKAQQSYEVACERTREIRKVALGRYEDFEPTKLRGTAWACYNACTEVSDWREGRGADISSVWGARAREKANAFAAALQVCN